MEIVKLLLARSNVDVKLKSKNVKTLQWLVTQIENKMNTVELVVPPGVL